MELFEIPEPDFASMDEAGADKAIQQLRREMANKGDSHPMNSSIHPQHGAFMSYQDRLYQKRYGGEDAAQKAETDAIIAAQKAAEQVKFRAQAEAELERLVGLGFHRDALPDNVEQFHVSALRMQRLNAEKNFVELVPLLEKELEALGASGVDAFRALVNDKGISPEERAEHVELILKRVYAANAETAGKSRR